MFDVKNEDSCKARIIIIFSVNFTSFRSSQLKFTSAVSKSNTQYTRLIVKALSLHCAKNKKSARKSNVTSQRIASQSSALERKNTSKMSGTNNRAGSFLPYVPEIVDMILRYLPAKELRSTARVSRMWRNIAMRILHSRTTWSVHYLADKLITGNEIDNVIENMFTEPRLVIQLSHREIWFTRREPRRRRNEERQLVRSVFNLFSKLPPGCATLGCTTERIVFQQPIDDLTPDHIHHLKTGHMFVCAPHMPGVDYHHVYLRTPKPPPANNWCDMFDLPANTPVKLVILIALSASRDFIPFIAAGIRETFGEQVVIFGGVGHDRLFIDGLVKRARVVALFISGQQFRACAGLLNNGSNADFYTPAHRLIEEASEDGFTPKFSLLFTSRFVHKGQAFYSSSQTAFKDGFTNTPMLGFYSYGEYCLTEKDTGVTKINDFKRLMRYNSAIYCVCSYRNEPQ